MKITFMVKEAEALEKIDNTICLNICRDNSSIKWGLDLFDGADCSNFREFAECYDTLESCVNKLDLIKKTLLDLDNCDIVDPATAIEEIEKIINSEKIDEEMQEIIKIK